MRSSRGRASVSRWLSGQPLLLQVLRGQAAPAHWGPAQWSNVVQQARMSSLLGRVAGNLLLACTRDGVVPPPGAAGQFDAAARVWRAQQAELQRELRYISMALAPLGAPVVLLKGAAYGATGLPPAAGRLFSDIDILVPRAALADAERLLTLAGWLGGPKTEYDQRYYRQWMHELPPMEHVHRGTVLDVHHTLLPQTARLQPDAARLFQQLVPVAGHAGLYVLPPAEMVLHSLTHLFMNDELSHALRDLSDLDLLLRHFGSHPGFWDQLAPAARHHQLDRLLHYALRFTQRLFGTPVPQVTLDQTTAAGPPLLLRPLMNLLWLNALQPPAIAASRFAGRASLFALYLRGHWLRMPPLMLARHLTIKALRLHEPKADSAVRTVG